MQHDLHLTQHVLQLHALSIDLEGAVASLAMEGCAPLSSWLNLSNRSCSSAFIAQVHALSLHAMRSQFSIAHDTLQKLQLSAAWHCSRQS